MFVHFESVHACAPAAGPADGAEGCCGTQWDASPEAEQRKRTDAAAAWGDLEFASAVRLLRPSYTMPLSSMQELVGFFGSEARAGLAGQPSSLAISASASGCHQPWARMMARRDHAPVRMPARCTISEGIGACVEYEMGRCSRAASRAAAGRSMARWRVERRPLLGDGGTSCFARYK